MEYVLLLALIVIITIPEREIQVVRKVNVLAVSPSA
jgi:hypothetical protein